MCGHAFSEGETTPTEESSEDSSKSRIRQRSSTNFIGIKAPADEAEVEKKENHPIEDDNEGLDTNNPASVEVDNEWSRPNTSNQFLKSFNSSEKVQSPEPVEKQERAEQVSASASPNMENQEDSEPKRKRKRRRRKRKKPETETVEVKSEVESSTDVQETEVEMEEPRNSRRFSEETSERDYHSEENDAELPEQNAEPASRPQRRTKRERAPMNSNSSDLVGWLVNFETPTGQGTELRAGRFFVSSEQVKPDDLVLNDSSISVPHCIFKATKEDGFKVQDLMSENGTWIKKAGESDYKELVEAQPVEHGDHLRLGDFEVLVCLIPKDKKKRSSKASTSKTVDKEDK